MTYHGVPDDDAFDISEATLKKRDQVLELLPVVRVKTDASNCCTVISHTVLDEILSPDLPVW